MKRLAVLFAMAIACAAEVQAANPVQLENAKPGTSDWMLFSESTNGEIEGYGSAMSVNQGESINFYVSTTAASYNIEIFRMGWYGGLGARRITSPVTRTGRLQTMPTPQPQTGLIECNWTDPYMITIPSDWVSGAYIAKLTTGQAPIKNRYILFVVREDSRPANHNFQLSVTTSQAYNNWGGKSLYSANSTGGAARVVSFNRPFTDGSGTGIFLWRYEYAAVRFLEREGYDVSYTTNIDAHRRGNLLLKFKSFLSIGHDEYWSWEMRANVEAARAAGVSLGFFSANTCYWQVRFEPSSITGALDRNMVAWKESAMIGDPYALDSDPSNDERITTKWRNAPVNRPESALIGVKYISFPVDADIVIDDVTSAPWVFTGTGLTSGSVLPGLLGYEVDAMDASSPPQTIRLGHSPFLDAGTNATSYSDMTVYSTGQSTVFATGSIQWAWGLDDWNSGGYGGSRVNAAAQQLTRNVLQKFAGSTAVADCQFTLTPGAASVGSGSGSGTITLATQSYCSWTVSSNAPWLTLSAPTSGTGNATLSYQFASNSNSPARNATITIGDKAFVVQQSSGCSYTFAPATASIGAAGGTASIAVTTTAACPWTTTTSTPWITLTSGSVGSGNGTIGYTVAPNDGPSRDGVITINGLAYSVHQSNGCFYSVEPTSIALPAAGGGGEVAIDVNGQCHWSASSGTSWIVLTGGLVGQGSGETAYQVQPNTTGAARTGTFTVAGVTVIVRQSADDCLYEISPLWASYTAAPATGSIAVASQCSFTAAVESGSSFLTITSTANGTVAYTIAENKTAAARTGTIRIAGRAVSITQNAAGVPFFSLVATASGATSALLAWTTVGDATSYEVYRSSNGGSFTLIHATSGTAFADLSLQHQRAYLYRIRAVGNGGPLAYSNIDVATLITFVDPTIVPRVTPIKDAHVSQLRNAVNAVRGAAALPSFPFTGSLIVLRSNIAELRAALDQARAAIGLPPLVYTDPVLTIIRAAHIDELRAGVR